MNHIKFFAASLAAIAAVLATLIIAPLAAGASENFSVSLVADNINCVDFRNGVDLTASVYNLQNDDGGRFTYNFFCNNGWSKTITSADTTVIVKNACQADNNSTVAATASVRVSRGGYSVTAQTAFDSFCQNRDTGKQLKASLYAEPSSGCAPMNGVSLRVVLSNWRASGAYNQDYYTYDFDCNNDGVFEKTITSGETEITAANICNYPLALKYTARVRVKDHYGNFATDTAIIKADACVYPPIYVPPISAPFQPIAPSPAGGLTVQKLVANLSNGTTYQNAVAAGPGDILSFKIIISGANGSLTVSDLIPSGIINVRDLQVNGVLTSGNIASGIVINTLLGRQEIITFSATVDSAAHFAFGQNILTNTATARTNTASNSSNATVYVWRQAIDGATKISTGITDNSWLDCLIAAGLIILCGLLWYIKNNYQWLLPQQQKLKKPARN